MSLQDKIFDIRAELKPERQKDFDDVIQYLSEIEQQIIIAQEMFKSAHALRQGLNDFHAKVRKEYEKMKREH